mmetsp:Transcript_10943/g.29349  ORF Transcript_10943/g.29349 Transcript_10943/m.29349 type:complete len:330 (-) Transcript_10943:218-1207(-)
MIITWSTSGTPYDFMLTSRWFSIRMRPMKCAMFPHERSSTCSTVVPAIQRPTVEPGRALVSAAWRSGTCGRLSSDASVVRCSCSQFAASQSSLWLNAEHTRGPSATNNRASLPTPCTHSGCSAATRSYSANWYIKDGVFFASSTRVHVYSVESSVCRTSTVPPPSLAASPALAPAPVPAPAPPPPYCPAARKERAGVDGGGGCDGGGGGGGGACCAPAPALASPAAAAAAWTAAAFPAGAATGASGGCSAGCGCASLLIVSCDAAFGAGAASCAGGGGGKAALAASCACGGTGGTGATRLAAARAARCAAGASFGKACLSAAATSSRAE